MKFRSSIFLSVLSSALFLANECYGQMPVYGQMTVSEYTDSIYYYCDTIYNGWYSSCEPLPNGDTLQIYIGPLNNKFEGLYIEKNNWGTFCGDWGYMVYTEEEDGIRDCRLHVFLSDTFYSQNALFYDGSEENPCWRTTMYFYSKNDTSEPYHIELRDRTGELIPIFYVSIEDVNHNLLFLHETQGNSLGVDMCEIPPETRYIKIAGKDPDVARGYCEYQADSGNVTFIILPTPNDSRISLFKGEMKFYPLNDYCKPNDNNTVHLLYRKQNDEYSTTPIE